MSVLAKSWLACLACALFASLLSADTKPQATAPATVSLIEKQAEAARKENRVDDAIKLYKKGLAIKPSCEEGWWSLRTLHYSLDQFAEARAAFRHLTAIQPSAGAPWAMLRLAEFQLKDYEQALSHLRHSADLHS